MAAKPAPPVLVVDTATASVVVALSDAGLGADSFSVEELNTPFPMAIDIPIASTATATPPMVHFFVREDLASPDAWVLFFITRDLSETGCRNVNTMTAVGRTTVWLAPSSGADRS
jgi:hypothetical protein